VGWVDILSLTVGAAGVAAAVWFYYHLWKWARDCQQATVAVAFKRKVVMSPTLVELLLWSRKVPDQQNGQVFYRAKDVTIAIVKRDRRSWLTRRRLRKNRPPGQAESQHGTWAIRQDKSGAAS
jgi:hypothetical protein